MPWWSWVIIWVVLVLAGLAMIVLFAIHLFRAAMRVFDALGQMTDKLALLDSASARLTEPAFHPTVFDDPKPLRLARAQRISERQLNRQLRKERRISRGTLLISADYRHQLPITPHPDQRS